MRKIRGLLLALALLGGAFGVVAQEDDSSPLLAILASAPDTPEARKMLSYVDYAAVARGAFDLDSYVSALRDVMSGPDMGYFMVQAEDQQGLIGVSVLEMLQSATWGQPPEQVTVYQGEFDPAAIEAAYSARDYTLNEAAGLTLFCGQAGCDAGNEMNMRNRDPGDPFGGVLGRQQPVLLVPLADDSYQLLSSPSLDVVTQSAEAATGAAPSLAAAADFQAAAHAISAEGTLRQAMFLSAEMVTVGDNDGAPLPGYTVLALAEVSTDDGLLASATLVFPTLADAEAAAPLLEARLAERDSLLEALANRGATYIVSAAEDAGTGLGITQVVFTATEEDARVYALLVRGLMTYELGWLGTE